MPDVTAIAPPFSLATAVRKVCLAEDVWNSRDPSRVILAYSTHSCWRSRSEFLCGREQIFNFLTRQWDHELDYRVVKRLWAVTLDRLAVKLEYEWHDPTGHWFRSYGNELWEFDDDGLMTRREVSINDVAIQPADRKFHWSAPGPRPRDYPGIE
jgi:uncharacterized protein